MSFISFFYLFFLVAVTAVYYWLPAKYRAIWLLGVSYFFYLTWQPAFLVVLIGITLISFLSGKKLASTIDKTQRKRWLIGSVITLLLPLFFFKYYNFLNENLASFGTWFSADNPTPVKQSYLVPLGISFFTFQSISYVVDIYRNYLAPEQKLTKYAVYIAFFPTLLAGPIERAKSILSQINNPASLDYQNIRAGLQLILWGVFKKVVLADMMANFLKKVYADPENFPGVLIYLAIVFTGLQIFCDFSAYSDIAVGSARMFGIRLTKNFDDRVYASSSREIFWKGWHRSLTAWMRDYVFFPLSQGVKNRTSLYINLLVVYLLVGLWHGPTWGFIAWGILNGLWLVGEGVSKKWRHQFFTRVGFDINGNTFYLLSWILVFHAGALFGVFFSTDTPQTALSFIEYITNPNTNLINNREVKNCFLIIIFFLFMDLINRKIPPNQNFDVFISGQKTWFRWVIYIVLAELILRYAHAFGDPRFVYFNF